MMLKIYGAIMRYFILFAAIQAMAFFLGSSDTTTITMVVLGMAVALFISAYLSAFRKDKRNKKSLLEAAF